MCQLLGMALRQIRCQSEGPFYVETQPYGDETYEIRQIDSGGSVIRARSGSGQ
ncbi:MAG: hypothetical protein R3C56_24475 [Pirellulaceae bacterium]